MPDNSLTTKHRKYRALLCIALLIYATALLVRATKITLDPALERDAGVYLSWVEHWTATGDYFYSFFGRVGLVPPLSLWLIKTLKLTGFSTEIAGRSISMFLGSLLPVVGFFFAWRICRNIRIALLAALVLILHPNLVEYSCQPLRESCYTFFNCILLFTFMEAVRKTTVFNWAACGVALSLTAYTRFEALEFILFAPLLLAALCWLRKMNWKDAIRSTAVFYFFFCLASVLLLACVEFDSRFFLRPLEHIAQIF